MISPGSTRCGHVGCGDVELDAFNQMLTVLETMAHLDLLTNREEVQRGLDGGCCVTAPRASRG